ncbi:MAG: MFS transporter [Deinococcota bacterium]
MSAWLILSGALLIQIVVANVTQGIPTLAPFIKADLSLSQSQVGLFTSYIFAGFFLGAGLSGWLTDRLSSRTVLIGGAACAGLIAAIIGYFQLDRIALVGLLMLLGLMGSTATPAGAQAVARAFDTRQRGLAMGLRQMGVPLGGALAAASLPVLAVRSSWRTAAAVSGVVALFAALITLFIYSRPRVRQHARRSKTAHRQGQVSGKLFKKPVLIACAAGTTLPVAQFIMVTYLMLYLRDSLGIPELRGAALLTLAQLIGAVSRVSFAALSDRLPFGRKPMLLAVIAMTGLSALSIAQLSAQTPTILVTTVVMVYAASALGWQGLYFTLLTELSDSGWEGRVLGLATTFTSLGIMSGPPLFGLLVDASSSYRPAWYALAAVVASGFVMLLTVQEQPTRSVAPATR